MKPLFLFIMLLIAGVAFSQEPTKQTINTGTTANDKTGDGLRTAFGKVNTNFTNIWNNVFWNSDVSTNGIIKRTGAGSYAIVLDYSDNWNTAYTKVSDTTTLLAEIEALSYIKLPILTQTQIDALTGANGMFVFNSTSGKLMYYSSGSWRTLALEQ